MPTGVRLACGTAGAPVGAHVHLAHEDWAITSDVAPDDPAMLDALLDAVLPGAVGCYVYPRDAVLHLTAAPATDAADVQRVLQRHRRRERAGRHRRLNQRTVAPASADDSATDDDDDAGDEAPDDEAGDDDADAAEAADDAPDDAPDAPDEAVDEADEPDDD
jgi:hypothetical protein